MSKMKSPKTKHPIDEANCKMKMKKEAVEENSKKRKADDAELVKKVYDSVTEIGNALYEVENMSTNGATNDINGIRSMLKAIKRGKMHVENAHKICAVVRSRAWMLGYRKHIANAAEKFDELFDSVIDSMEV